MENIAIWGAGKFGSYVLEQLQKNETANIVCIIDNHADLKEKGNIDIVDPSAFLAKYIDKTDYILVAFWDAKAIRKQLHDMGIKLWGEIDNCVYSQQLQLLVNLHKDKNIIWNSDKEFNLAVIDTLETHVVDYCNLNCKGCSHFSNLFDKGAQIPYEIFERDIKHLSNKIYIKNFNLLGGEALLSERIEDYISCLGEYMPKTNIVLVTNGILIPSLKQEVLECMAKYSVRVSITEYLPIKKLKDKMVLVLEQYNIDYEFREGIDTFGKNIDLLGKNDPEMAQQMCRESTCQFLRNGEIFKCPFSALGNYFFNYYNIPLHFKEGINIFDENIEWDGVAEKLRKQPIEQCKYCGPEERFPWEVSLHPQKEEWLIHVQ